MNELAIVMAMSLSFQALANDEVISVPMTISPSGFNSWEVGDARVSVWSSNKKSRSFAMVAWTLKKHLTR